MATPTTSSPRRPSRGPPPPTPLPPPRAPLPPRTRGVEETSLGLMPRYEDLNWTGLEKLSAARYAELARVDAAAWKDELASHDELFAKLGKRLPAALEARRDHMHQKLAA